MSDDKGPQLKDYRGKYDSPDEDFLAWSFMRRKWLKYQSQLNRLYPFRAAREFTMLGDDNPIPLLREPNQKKGQ